MGRVRVRRWEAWQWAYGQLLEMGFNPASEILDKQPLPKPIIDQFAWIDYPFRYVPMFPDVTGRLDEETLLVRYLNSLHFLGRVEQATEGQWPANTISGHRGDKFIRPFMGLFTPYGFGYYDVPVGVQDRTWQMAEFAVAMKRLARKEDKAKLVLGPHTMYVQMPSYRAGVEDGRILVPGEDPIEEGDFATDKIIGTLRDSSLPQVIRERDRPWFRIQGFAKGRTLPFDLMQVLCIFRWSAARFANPRNTKKQLTTPEKARELREQRTEMVRVWNVDGVAEIIVRMQAPDAVWTARELYDMTVPHFMSRFLFDTKISNALKVGRLKGDTGGNRRSRSIHCRLLERLVALQKEEEAKDAHDNYSPDHSGLDHPVHQGEADDD